MGNGWTSQYIESRIKFLLVYVMHWTWYRYVDNNNSHAYSKESGSQNPNQFHKLCWYSKLKKTLINNTLLDHYIESGELFRCWAHLKAMKVLYAGSMVFLTNVAKTYNKSLQT